MKPPERRRWDGVKPQYVVFGHENLYNQQGVLSRLVQLVVSPRHTAESQLPLYFPQHVLPRPLIAPDQAVLPLAPKRYTHPLCHEPQEPLVALVQGPLD